MRHQVQFLVDHHHPGGFGHTRRAENERAALEADRAGVGLVDAAHDLHQRRLAGTVFAAQRVDLPRADIEIHAIERPDTGKRLGDAHEPQQWHVLGSFGERHRGGRQLPEIGKTTITTNQEV
jgi:hypothetical protein